MRRLYNQLHNWGMCFQGPATSLAAVLTFPPPPLRLTSASIYIYVPLGDVLRPSTGPAFLPDSSFLSSPFVPGCSLTPLDRTRKSTTGSSRCRCALAVNMCCCVCSRLGGLGGCAVYAGLAACWWMRQPWPSHDMLFPLPPPELLRSNWAFAVARFWRGLSQPVPAKAAGVPCICASQTQLGLRHGVVSVLWGMKETKT